MWNVTQSLKCDKESAACVFSIMELQIQQFLDIAEIYNHSVLDKSEQAHPSPLCFNENRLFNLFAHRSCLLNLILFSKNKKHSREGEKGMRERKELKHFQKLRITLLLRGIFFPLPYSVLFLFCKRSKKMPCDCNDGASELLLSVHSNHCLVR